MKKLQFSRVAAAALVSVSAIALAAPAFALFGEKPVGPISVPKAGDVATPSALAKDFLMLNFARTEQRLVAVGEYGHVLLSDDEGKTWRQSKTVPTKVTLTSVVFPGNGKLGWAAGHDTVILHTNDGGETWTRQFGGGDNDDALLTVVFTDTSRGLAMGAFNYTVETNDGGKTWTKRKLAEDAKPAGAPPAAAAPAAPADPAAAPSADDLQAKADAEAEAKAKASGVDGAYAVAEGDDAHINHGFTGPNGLVVVAAEAGKVYRSTDGGKVFQRIQTEYPGSFWGGTVLADGAIVIVGMRGNIWRSTDQGQTWVKTDTGKADQSIASVIQMPDGTIIAAGLSGGLLVSKDGGKTFAVRYRDDRKSLNAVTATSDGRILVAGEAGIHDVTKEIEAMPAATPSAAVQPAAPAPKAE
jgi:photosystem II stability/assembly factor-like uncharacterized protein